MYQIDIGSLKSMLEATAAFRTALETLNENLETRLTAMDTCWSGDRKRDRSGDRLRPAGQLLRPTG